jgi:hypothetical protein
MKLQILHVVLAKTTAIPASSGWTIGISICEDLAAAIHTAAMAVKVTIPARIEQSALLFCAAVVNGT